MNFFPVAVFLTLIAETTARTFTVYNHCPFTIWPAIFTDTNISTSVPDYATGWESPAYQSVQFYVPDDWKAGRIWGRRNCNFASDTPGAQSCLDGGCNGGLECDKYTGTGAPPATVAEFTLGTNGADDFYYVSLVQGYNLPMRIDNTQGCGVADCPVDIGPGCPSPLIGPYDSNHYPVGCKSACEADLVTSVDNPNCCTGYYNNPETCTPSSVAYYSYFKNNCPNSIVYVFDSGLKTCPPNVQADYTVTFCP